MPEHACSRGFQVTLIAAAEIAGQKIQSSVMALGSGSWVLTHNMFGHVPCTKFEIRRMKLASNQGRGLTLCPEGIYATVHVAGADGLLV